MADVIEPIDPREAKKLPGNKIIYLCTGSQGEPMGAMTRISNNSHPDVLWKKVILLYFHQKLSLVMKKNLYKLHNQLVKDGINVISEDNEFVHVSGHPK